MLVLTVKLGGFILYPYWFNDYTQRIRKTRPPVSFYSVYVVHDDETQLKWLQCRFSRQTFHDI